MVRFLPSWAIYPAIVGIYLRWLDTSALSIPLAPTVGIGYIVVTKIGIIPQRNEERCRVSLPQPKSRFCSGLALHCFQRMVTAPICVSPH